MLYGEVNVTRNQGDLHPSACEEMNPANNHVSELEVDSSQSRLELTATF